MMRFTAYPEIQLNRGMRDVGDYRWAKPTHLDGIYLGVDATEHRPSTNVSRYICYTSRAWV
jgi:hypothetical protein